MLGEGEIRLKEGEEKESVEGEIKLKVKNGVVRKGEITRPEGK